MHLPKFRVWVPALCSKALTPHISLNQDRANSTNPSFSLGSWEWERLQQNKKHVEGFFSPLRKSQTQSWLSGKFLHQQVCFQPFSSSFSAPLVIRDPYPHATLSTCHPHSQIHYPPASLKTVPCVGDGLGVAFTLLIRLIHPNSFLMCGISRCERKIEGRARLVCGSSSLRGPVLSTYFTTAPSPSF